MHKRTLAAITAIICLLCGVAGSLSVAYADTTDSTTYGSGGYGGCEFGSCTLTLTSGSATSTNVVPGAGTKCTVQSDTVSVLTNSNSGYSLSMTTSSTNNAQTGSSGSISASAGTSASPLALAANTWGWRVDGLAGFGAGPTSSQNSGSTPGVTFAGVPPSNGTPSVLASTSSPANPAAQTVVWYGACAKTSLPSGSYSATVVYTAITN